MKQTIAWVLSLTAWLVVVAACGNTVEINTGYQEDDTSGTCVPNCLGKQCGSNGCGGVCGGCAVGELCISGSCFDKSEVPEDAYDLIEDINWPDDDTGPDPDESGPGNDSDAATPPPDQKQPDTGGLVCVTVFDDNDNDGFGDAATANNVCEISSLPEGKAIKYGDCNDSDPLVGPGGTEICDNIDNDCDTLTDEGCDADDDGYCTKLLPVVGTPSTCPYGANDCNDDSAEMNPGNPELQGDALDNDCDGTVDEATQCPGVCTGHSVDAFLCALEICQGMPYSNPAFSSPTGDDIDSAWDSVNHYGSAANDLAPLGGNSYGLLGTGPVLGTSHSTDLPGGSTTDDNYSGDSYDTLDNVEFYIKMTAPASAQGFAIDYIFFSEEYEEFIGTSYNDKFYILLKAPQTTNNKWTVINFTDCRSPGSYYDFIDPNTNEKQCYIAINTAFSEPCSNPTTDISGTGFECGSADMYHGSSTGWLYTQWPVKPNETFELKFHIHDTSDGIYDSAVILDNFHWLTQPFTPGTASHN